MKLKQRISAFGVIAMLLSVIVPSRAVSLPEIESLSEYAGETITCQVLADTEDGLTSRFVEVAIPEGATVEEEIALVNAAAFGADLYTRNVRATDDKLSVMRNFTITSEDTYVGGGAAKQDYKCVFAQFTVESMGGITTIDV